MSAEDKTAAIRREVEERAIDPGRFCSPLAARAADGVVIYGVPLAEEEAKLLRSVVAHVIAKVDVETESARERLVAIWEMLERGKK